MEKPESTVNSLVDAIRAEIMTGKLGPGQKIDQIAWAERMKASRTPVRLALERLESEGFVTLLPRRGAVIRELTTSYVEDVLATRIVLESGLGRAGARNLSKQDLAILHKVLAEIEAVALPDRHIDLLDPTHRFHAQIYEAAGTWMLHRFCKQAVDHTTVFLSRYWYANRRIAHVAKRYYRELYEACESRRLDDVERLIRDFRIDLAGVILQDRAQTKDLGILPGILTASELERLAAIVDHGQEPSGPSPVLVADSSA